MMHSDNNHEKQVIKMNWQSIDTAPKDGRDVITRRPTTPPHVEAMYYRDGRWHWSFDGDSPETQPTQWVPMPAEE